MKRIILTVSAFFTLCLANAQEIKYGVKAGLNVSTLVGDFETESSLIGIHAGGFAEFKITDKFSIQPEILYSTQGAESKYYVADEFSSTLDERKIKLGYLNIPVIAKYFVFPGFSIEAGPQIGFLLSAKNEYKFDNFINERFTGSGEIDIKNQVKSVDFGFNIGAGYEFTDNIFIQARYTLGLTDVFEESYAPAVNDFKAQNSVLQVSFGYKF